MENIICKANALVKRYKTRNPFELAEYLNITIKYGEFSKLKGFYNYSYRNRFIVLNSRLDKAEKIITGLTPSFWTFLPNIFCFLTIT
jgi:hypothetical protein